MSGLNHFLDLSEIPADALRGIVEQSKDMKNARADGDTGDEPLAGKSLAMIFEKPSTRTRVSFEVAMRQLGGHAVMLTGSELQLNRGETPEDTARVLSRYVDAIMIRTFSSDVAKQLAAAATVPVINGLTNDSHPCQLMADVMTFEEHRGDVRGKVFAWSGDGNNVAASWIHAAQRFGFELRIATPEELRPPQHLLDWAQANGANIKLMTDPQVAATDADAVVTDCWVSMGDDDVASRHNMLAPYRVDEALMAKAKSDALFMHCLPAHRGEEVTAEVIDGPQSIVFDEAENRLHSQKGILRWCLGL
ncbi:MAG: ornithine carbamoyltransferase [Alphaproteobacteria bacterium]|nr:ornithine carbamoyltransferase [Alphaproteobacteria bacterium]